MNNFRSRRLEIVVYQRRLPLLTEYENYATHPSPDTRAFHLLPHVADIVHFPLFRDIIRAPECAQMDFKPFESAFAQLPALAEE